jgi:hypothetical protein
MLSSSQRLPDQARWEGEAISIIPVCEGCVPAILASNRRIPSRRVTHRRVPRMLTTPACRITILFILFSSCFFLTSYWEVGVPPKGFDDGRIGVPPGFCVGIGLQQPGPGGRSGPGSGTQAASPTSMHMRNSAIKMNLPRWSRDRALISVTTSAVITDTEPIVTRIAAIVFDPRFLFCVLLSFFKMYKCSP